MLSELIERLGLVPGVLVLETGSVWVRRIDAGPAWFWEDWIDYEGYDDTEDLSVLMAGMCGDIEHFVALLGAAEDFRVLDSGKLFKSTTARWKHGGKWRDVWPLAT